MKRFVIGLALAALLCAPAAWAEEQQADGPGVGGGYEPSDGPGSGGGYTPASNKPAPAEDDSGASGQPTDGPGSGGGYDKTSATDGPGAGGGYVAPPAGGGN